MHRKKRKFTDETLLDAFREKHGFKYRYPPFPEKYTVRTPIIIICPQHGRFSQLIGHHLDGQECKKCAYIKRKTSYLGRAAWIKRFESVHGKGTFNYSKIPERVQNETKIEIYCNEHNCTFNMLASLHYRFKRGCPKCKTARLNEIKTLNIVTRREFEKKVKSIHGLAFEYFELPQEFSLNDEIIIFCNEHNQTFFCVAEEHLKGKGCPHCSEISTEK